MDKQVNTLAEWAQDKYWSYSGVQKGDIAKSILVTAALHNEIKALRADFKEVSAKQLALQERIATALEEIASPSKKTPSTAKPVK